jgi:translocator protein
MSASRGDVAPTRAGWLGLAGWLAVSFAAAAIGGIASARAAGFYATLDRPEWAPPSGVFGPVWTVLYVLMGVAAWLVWREEGGRGRARAGLTLFVLQLVLNALWTWLFFVWRRGALALAEVVVLLVVVALTAVAFARVRRLAAVLLLPYLAWLAFATALTAAVWRRNPTLL